MNDRDDQRSDQEQILIALDQISQTIDVMTSVVGRLRGCIEAQGEARGERSTQGPETPPPEIATDRILH